MSINPNDVRVERITGKKKAGGANRNCTNSCIRLTHTPSGIVVKKDGRNQGKNLKMAWKELERRLADVKQEKEDRVRKDRRDLAIKDDTVIRTYKFKENIVIDHRSGKTANLDKVLKRGRIDLLKENRPPQSWYDNDEEELF